MTAARSAAGGVGGGGGGYGAAARTGAGGNGCTSSGGAGGGLGRGDAVSVAAGAGVGAFASGWAAETGGSVGPAGCPVVGADAVAGNALDASVGGICVGSNGIGADSRGGNS